MIGTESKTMTHKIQTTPEVRDRIVELMGDVPRIELFARAKTEGWSVWGNEITSDVAMMPNDKAQ
jgi:N6-adenosine-specific RNA methylase IME4